MLSPGLQRQYKSSLLLVFALGVLVAAGDVITQQFAERRGTSHDFRRTARMGVVGLVIGPVLRSWYLTLERIIPGSAKTAGFKKDAVGSESLCSCYDKLLFQCVRDTCWKTTT